MTTELREITCVGGNTGCLHFFEDTIVNVEDVNAGLVSTDGYFLYQINGSEAHLCEVDKDEECLCRPDGEVCIPCPAGCDCEYCFDPDCSTCMTARLTELGHQASAEPTEVHNNPEKSGKLPAHFCGKCSRTLCHDCPDFEEECRG